MFMRCASVLTAILTASLLVSCATGEAPTTQTESELAPHLNSVLDESDDVIEEIMAEFPDTEVVAREFNIYGCDEPGAGDSMGHWISAMAFSTTDIPGGVKAVREKFADIESSYGTKKQAVTYADGTTWPAPSHHLLLEDESGSYLLTFDGQASGIVQTRVDTACGQLR